MPAKPLSPEQREDAARLKSLFKEWQETQRLKGDDWSQDYAAERLGFGQSALSQYLNGKIPLNIEVAGPFASLIGKPIEAFSPALASTVAGLTKALEPSPQFQDPGHQTGENPAKQPAALLPNSPGPRYLVMRLAELLRPLDKTDRSSASAILRDLALEPDAAEEMAAKLVRLLGKLPLNPTNSQGVRRKI